VFLVRGNTDEMTFRDIDKIKLRPLSSMTGQRLLGFFVGGISGGVITGTILSTGRSGEPRALAGVVGGIAGGIIFGITGALLAPVICKMISTKKIVVQHTAEFYLSLKQKLLRYCR
jgi:outer membrane lipoprotein SlyB